MIALVKLFMVTMFAPEIPVEALSAIIPTNNTFLSTFVTQNLARVSRCRCL
jgi:hypothetical protein